LLLGIKATLSVAELMTQKLRLKAGRESKAARGELYRFVAPGYVVNDIRLVKDPDLRVQEAIAMVFSKFPSMTSVRQLMKWFNQESMELPLNKKVNGKWQIGWQLPKYTYLKYILQNPAYAGAYFYGRTETRKVIVNGEIRNKIHRNNIQDSRVFIRDHHEGYITWQEFEKNQKMIAANNQKVAKADDSVTGIRRGQGILAGLIRCGRCGRKLHVRYKGKSGTAARYLCNGNFDAGGKYCLSFGGATVDKNISSEILRIISPLTIKASLAAIKELGNEHSEKQRAFELRIQQQEYEVGRAFEQYDKVDPNNRLVAAQLEERWNNQLVELTSLKDEFGHMERDIQPLEPEEIRKILSIGEDFSEFWKCGNTGNDLKKKIVRILLKELIVSLDDKTNILTFILHWQGGSHTKLSMPKKMQGHKGKSQEDSLNIIRKMALRYHDDQIANVLAKLGRKNGSDFRWSKLAVAGIRQKHNLPEVQESEDILTLGQAEGYAGVSDTTLMKLIKSKILPAKQVVPFAPFEISKFDLDSEPVHSILLHLKSTGKLEISRVPSVIQPALFE